MKSGAAKLTELTNTGLKKIIVITGPTASGKSALALSAALKFGGEIVSADSMQIYKGLDIGTAKPTAEERAAVPHHIIDIAEPHEEYSVGQYKTDASAVIDEICARGRLPIITGGTGLYIDALLYGHNFAGAPKSKEIREKYSALLKEKGAEYLYALLAECDPASHLKIHLNDTKRIIRALEIYELTGRPKGDFMNAYDFPPRYDALIIGIDRPRAELYGRINARADEMLAAGLIGEVKGLIQYKDCQSMQAIGYREIISYLGGEINETDAIELIKQNTRRYAKRQITYMKALPDIQWIYAGDSIMSDIIQYIVEHMNK